MHPPAIDPDHPLATVPLADLAAAYESAWADIGRLRSLLAGLRAISPRTPHHHRAETELGEAKARKRTLGGLLARRLAVEHGWHAYRPGDGRVEYRAHKDRRGVERTPSDQHQEEPDRE